MSRLPAVKPREVITALSKAGFETVRIRGSHYQLLNPVTKRRVTVPTAITISVAGPIWRGDQCPAASVRAAWSRTTPRSVKDNTAANSASYERHRA
jgi:predicted RNA binding protein YcfA (HicA-like mRNA interferase family)